MDNMEELRQSVNMALVDQKARAIDATNEKEYYEALRNEAITEEKKAKLAVKELESAKEHIRKAMETENFETVRVHDRDYDYEYYNSHETDDSDVKVYEVTRTTTDNNSKDEGKVGRVIAWVAVLALLGTAGYVLYRQSKNGEVKSVTAPTKSAAIAASTPDNNTTTINNGSYNYDNNEVVIYDGAQVSENNNYGYSYNGNVFTSNDSNYVVLDESAFEKLTVETADVLKNKYKLAVSNEDIVKYVMVRNIDKLRQDNNGIISMVIGNQDPTEVFADADHVIDAIMTYNLLYFDAHHNTDGFISASVGVFDDTQRSRVIEIEKRVYEIGANYQNEKTYNELTYALLKDMINPANEISELEDGVSYGLEWIDMYMVRTTFGTDAYIKLNDTNADLIKYFVSLVGDGEEYENNAIVNGNVRNINALMEECEKGKTLTK